MCTHLAPRQLDALQNATFGQHAALVRWLNDAVGPNDVRGFDPEPIFQFACDYALLNSPPEHIYKNFVAYQCAVYDHATKYWVSVDVNVHTFTDLQRWYEDLRPRNTPTNK